MRVRFTSSLLAPPWLRDQRGTIIGFMFHPADRRLYYARGSGELFSPSHFLEGILLQLDDFTGSIDDFRRSPHEADLLEGLQDELQEDEVAQEDPARKRQRVERAGGMFVLRPRAVEFLWRNGGARHQVRRTGFPLTHADYLTARSSSGQLLRRGVTIDCGRRTFLSDGEWWLHLYAMFSCVTRMEDLLLLRPPPRRLLEAGPPACVLRALRRFEEKAHASGTAAMDLADELGWIVPN